jgi:hypothetical protein
MSDDRRMIIPASTGPLPDPPAPGPAAPELAAAMAETRQIRHALIVLTAEWASAAATAEEAREVSSDGCYRMMLGQRADLLRQHARKVRDAIGGQQ